MRKECGFSLLEVLLAISILAVAILAIASMFPTGYTTVHRSGVDTVAVTLAQQRLEWLRNQAYLSAALAAGTTTEPSLSGYAGYVRTTLIQDNAPVSGVKRVTVTVVAPAGRRVQITSLRAK
jgi:type IV pilus assembly protein PilV